MSNAHEFQNREIGIVLREKDYIQELLIDAEEEIPEVVKIFIDTLQQYEWSFVLIWYIFTNEELKKIKKVIFQKAIRRGKRREWGY